MERKKPSAGHHFHMYAWDVVFVLKLFVGNAKISLAFTKLVGGLTPAESTSVPKMPCCTIPLVQSCLVSNQKPALVVVVVVVIVVVVVVVVAVVVVAVA
eukprot:2341053-Amphidinium_carterae.1